MVGAAQEKAVIMKVDRLTVMAAMVEQEAQAARQAWEGKEEAEEATSDSSLQR